MTPPTDALVRTDPSLPRHSWSPSVGRQGGHVVPGSLQERHGTAPRSSPSLLLAVLLAAVIATTRPAGAVATPTSTLAGLGDTLIGEEFTFTATFDESGSDTGYAPFIDLLFPRNGADGAAGADTPDGIEFVGVRLPRAAGPRVDRLPVPDDDGAGPGTTGTVEHPLTGELITTTAGDELVVLSTRRSAALRPVSRRRTWPSPPASARSPTPGSRSASGSTPASRSARRPWTTPGTDPPLLGDTDTDATTWSSTDVVPTVLLLDKESLGPEDETATGPNFPRQYRITVDLPDGQTVTDLDLVDAFPDELAFLAVDSITPAGTVVAAPPVGASSTGSTTRGERPDRHRYRRSGRRRGARVVLRRPARRLGGRRRRHHVRCCVRSSRTAVTALGDWDPVDGRDDASADNVAAGPAEASLHRPVGRDPEVRPEPDRRRQLARRPARVHDRRPGLGPPRRSTTSSSRTS